jgi:hypothetical protein
MLRRFFSDHYLFVTFIISLATAVLAAVVLYGNKVTDPDLTVEAVEAATHDAANLAIVILVLGLLFTWPQWFLSKLNAIVRSAVASLGTSEQKSDQDFKRRVGSKFGDELVSNIVTYETYCKNEYILDMQKHHFAWLMLAVSGSITVLAALFVTFTRGADDIRWIEAVGVTLPALVTGVLLKIWLETRENLKKTRIRTDAIYRQRIRLLLLIGDHVGREPFSLSESIDTNTKLLNYIRLPNDHEYEVRET